MCNDGLGTPDMNMVRSETKYTMLNVTYIHVCVCVSLKLLNSEIRTN